MSNDNLIKRLETAEAELAAVKAELASKGKAWVHGRQKYYYLNSDGKIDYASVSLTGPLNSFPDLKTAERMLKWLALMDKMRIAADGYKWNENKDNWVVFKHWQIVKVTMCQPTMSLGGVYFATQDAAQAFIDNLTPDEVETFKAGFPVY